MKNEKPTRLITQQNKPSTTIQIIELTDERKVNNSLTSNIDSQQIIGLQMQKKTIWNKIQKPLRRKASVAKIIN